jgi:hypothetical protein
MFYAQSCPWTMVLLISVSQEEGITGIHHLAYAMFSSVNRHTWLAAAILECIAYEDF